MTVKSPYLNRFSARLILLTAFLLTACIAENTNLGNPTNAKGSDADGLKGMIEQEDVGQILANFLDTKRRKPSIVY